MEALLPEAALAEETAPVPSPIRPAKRPKARASKRQLALIERVCALIEEQDGEPVTLAARVEGALDRDPPAAATA